MDTTTSDDHEHRDGTRPGSPLSRRQVLRIAGAAALLPALAACSRPTVKLDWVDRLFRDHPAVAAVELYFTEDPTFFWQSARAPRFAFGSVDLKPDLSADEVVAFTRYVADWIHRESPDISGHLPIQDPGSAGERRRGSGEFTFPDFGRYPPVEVIEARTRYWLDLGSRYADAHVAVSLGTRSDVDTSVHLGESDAPAALAAAYGDFTRHTLPRDVSTSWAVSVPDPTFDRTNPESGRASWYSSRTGLPPEPAVRAMTSLATLNQQLGRDELATISASWRADAGDRPFFDVSITLRPRELRDPSTSEIHGAIPGSTAPRLADAFLAQLDGAGVPYKAEVRAFQSRPFVTVDRTTG